MKQKGNVMFSMCYNLFHVAMIGSKDDLFQIEQSKGHTFDMRFLNMHTAFLMLNRYIHVRLSHYKVQTLISINVIGCAHW